MASLFKIWYYFINQNIKFNALKFPNQMILEYSRQESHTTSMIHTYILIDFIRTSTHNGTARASDVTLHVGAPPLPQRPFFGALPLLK